MDQSYFRRGVIALVLVAKLGSAAETLYLTEDGDAFVDDKSRRRPTSKVVEGIPLKDVPRDAKIC